MNYRKEKKEEIENLVSTVQERKKEMENEAEREEKLVEEMIQKFLVFLQFVNRTGSDLKQVVSQLKERSNTDKWK